MGVFFLYPAAEGVEVRTMGYGFCCRKSTWIGRGAGEGIEKRYVMPR